MTPRNLIHVAPQWQPIFREIGIDAEAIFTHPDIKPWRTLPDRENCILDATLVSGERIRLHVKRYVSGKPGQAPRWMNDYDGHEYLTQADIPTLDLVAYGEARDGRNFVVSNDLAGYQAADKLIDSPKTFDRLLIPTADLAAKLHRSNLHHRDLYLCHFFAKLDEHQTDIKLIDVTRVGLLPRFTRQRWIVKDLAQFWYSSLALPIEETQRQAWLARYVASRGIRLSARLRNAILRKVKWIERHDRKLVKDQPNRNISIPGS